MNLALSFCICICICYYFLLYDVKFSRRERNLSGVQSVDCELSRRGWTFFTNLPSVSCSPGPVLCEILYFPNIPHFCLQPVAILSGKRSENPYSYNLLPTNNSFAWINIHQQYLTLMSALRKVQIQEITKVPLWLLPTPTPWPFLSHRGDGLWPKKIPSVNIYWHPWFGPLGNTFGCREVSFADNPLLCLTRCFRGTSSFEIINHPLTHWLTDWCNY